MSAASDPSGPGEASPEPAVDAIARRAEAALKNVDPAPFTPGAFKEVQVSVSTYIRSLVAESAKTAERRQNDGVVSTADVRHASQYLSSARKSKVTDHLGTLGGILLGAGLGNLVSLIASDDLALASVIVTLVLSVAGVAMVAFQIASDH